MIKETKIFVWNLFQKFRAGFTYDAFDFLHILFAQ